MRPAPKRTGAVRKPDNVSACHNVGSGGGANKLTPVAAKMLIGTESNVRNANHNPGAAFMRSRLTPRRLRRSAPGSLGAAVGRAAALGQGRPLVLPEARSRDPCGDSTGCSGRSRWHSPRSRRSPGAPRSSRDTVDIWSAAGLAAEERGTLSPLGVVRVAIEGGLGEEVLRRLERASARPLSRRGQPKNAACSYASALSSTAGGVRRLVTVGAPRSALDHAGVGRSPSMGVVRQIVSSPSWDRHLPWSIPSRFGVLGVSARGCSAWPISRRSTESRKWLMRTRCTISIGVQRSGRALIRRR